MGGEGVGKQSSMQFSPGRGRTVMSKGFIYSEKEKKKRNKINFSKSDKLRPVNYITANYTTIQNGTTERST